VVIHDFTLDEPLKKDRYPEPDYRNLSRGRILHVFRDRGGEDETDDTPATPEHELTPVGV